MASYCPTPEEMAKRLRIPHTVGSMYDVITAQMRIKIKHATLDKAVFEALDLSYTPEQLADKLLQMQRALEKEP